MIMRIGIFCCIFYGGVALEENGTCGLIQGDSFSPMLFVFVMEAMVSQWAVLIFLLFCLLMML